jgi:hypothetical protein
MKINTAFFNNGVSFCKGDVIDYVYARGRRQQVTAMTDLYPVVISNDNFKEHADKLAGVEAIFAIWGMPELTSAELDRLPALRAAFYAAGSVKGFAKALLQRRMTVRTATRWFAWPTP